MRLPLDGVLQILRVDLLERDVNTVTGGHQVVVVHQLDRGKQKQRLISHFNRSKRTKIISRPTTHLQERLDLGTLLQLGLAHAVGHFAGVPVDTGDQRVSKLFVGTAVIEGLDDDRLASCVPAAQDQHDFVRLHDLPHLGDSLEGRGKSKLISRSCRLVKVGCGGIVRLWL